MNSKSKGLNDLAWEALFAKYDILNQVDMHHSFQISASQIKELREPRLMAKFDHRINLPQIFADNQLSILPTSRKDYIISSFDTYHKFEALDTSIIKASLPSHIQSLDIDNIPSEAVAINCALASGILSDFLEEGSLSATVSGRMGSDSFEFNINNLKPNLTSHVTVNNSQIEIDAAFEGMESLSLLEAKRDISEDFLVRQLYYPFRVWYGRITKQVRPVFLVYSNGIFSLYEYIFEVPNLYNSLKLIKQKNYTLEDTEIEIGDLLSLMQNVILQPEPNISFPQADNFNRVINLCELLSANELSREDITEEYAFDIRQTNYYTDAARYLGLVEKSYDNRTPLYKLTKNGKQIMGLHFKQRQLAFCKAILQHKVFYDVFKTCMDSGIVPDRNYIVQTMKSLDLYHIESDSTYVRRASTISSWISWILGLI